MHAPEHVHEYEGEHGGEEERANVPRHTADHIQERFLVVDEVEKLQCTWTSWACDKTSNKLSLVQAWMARLGLFSK